MALWIKQSTATDLPIGPFLDSTDGFTAETALTLTQPDIRLKKNGGAWAQKNAAQTLSHEENGFYEVSLDATDTDTLGVLKLAVNESGALPVWHDFMVVPANVWDSLFGADKLQVDATELLGDGQSATDLKDFADAGYDPATNKVAGVVLVDTLTTYTGNTPQTGDSFARLGAPAGASVSADIAVIESQTDDIGVAGAGLTAVVAASVTGNVGGNVVGSVGSVGTNGITSGSLDASAISEIAGGISIPSVNAIADQVWDEDLSGHRQPASAGAAQQIVHAGTAQAGGASTITLNAGASAIDDDYNNQVLHIIDGTGVGQAEYIADYVGATKVATMSAAWAVVPDATSVFVIRPSGLIPGASAPTAGEVADAVWDEALAGHLAAGSTGEALNAAGAAGDPWVTALPGAYGAGSAGNIVGNNLNATVSSRASQASVDTVDANVDAALADTNELQTDWANGGRLDLILDARASQATADAIEADTQDLQTKIGTPAGVSLAADIAAVEGQTDDIGVAGAGLTAVPWNAAWDAEVQSEVADALTAFGAATAAAVAGVQADTDAIQTTLGTPAGVSLAADIAAIEAQTDDIGAAGAGLTAVPWNAAWDAEVQSEVADALAVYDPPTQAELTAATANLDAAVSTRATPAQVNTEVVDVLRVDTLPELSQAQPAATPTFATATMLQYMAFRNAGEQDASQQTIKNDTGTVIAKMPLSDDGTTTSKGKIVSGP